MQVASLTLFSSLSVCLSAGSPSTSRSPITTTSPAAPTSAPCTSLTSAAGGAATTASSPRSGSSPAGLGLLTFTSTSRTGAPRRCRPTGRRRGRCRQQRPPRRSGRRDLQCRAWKVPPRRRVEGGSLRRRDFSVIFSAKVTVKQRTGAVEAMLGLFCLQTFKSFLFLKRSGLTLACTQKCDSGVASTSSQNTGGRVGPVLKMQLLKGIVMNYGLLQLIFFFCCLQMYRWKPCC